MKPAFIPIALVSAILAGASGISYWDMSSGTQDKAFIAHPEASTPVAFGGLPPLANVDQYAERIHALGRNVSEKEQAALVAWINRSKPAHLTNSAWHHLVNEVMDALCHQTHPLASWSDVLIGIVRGKDNDPTLRDYAIQHLVDWIQPINIGEPCEFDPTKRRAIIAIMVDVANQSRENLSGTALQGLHLILLGRQRSEQQKEPSAKLPLPLTVEQLRPLAVYLATAEGTTNISRMTALQVCAQRGFSEILPTARRIAGDTMQPFSLRISAIAAVGQIGNAEDAFLLNKVQEEQNPSLFYALKAAFKKINKQAVPAITATHR